jgi:hypothetical protein
MNTLTLRSDQFAEPGADCATSRELAAKVGSGFILREVCNLMNKIGLKDLAEDAVTSEPFSA